MHINLSSFHLSIYLYLYIYIYYIQFLKKIKTLKNFSKINARNDGVWRLASTTDMECIWNWTYCTRIFIKVPKPSSIVQHIQWTNRGLLGIANWKQNFSLNTEKRKKYLTTIKMTREEPESQTVVVSTPSSGGNSSKSAQKNLE